jgi:hypothetical protein
MSWPGDAKGWKRHYDPRYERPSHRVTRHVSRLSHFLKIELQQEQDPGPFLSLAPCTVYSHVQLRLHTYGTIGRIVHRSDKY